MRILRAKRKCLALDLSDLTLLISQRGFFIAIARLTPLLEFRGAAFVEMFKIRYGRCEGQAALRRTAIERFHCYWMVWVSNMPHVSSPKIDYIETDHVSACVTVTRHPRFCALRYSGSFQSEVEKTTIRLKIELSRAGY